MKTKIAVIGLGFVGGTIHKSLLDKPDLECIGIDPAKGFDVPYSTIKDAVGIFVCVPSPMNTDGSADVSILKNVLKDLKSINYQGVIISKVTAPPDVYASLQYEFPNLVHSPEFLTAANAYHDYINGSFAIIGGDNKEYVNIADRLIHVSQPYLKKVMHCSIKEASLTKYAINSFLATKVLFMNEMATLSNATGCDWNNIKDLMQLDQRVGQSHMQVPGPDGHYGFGGYCFPKDTRALLFYADSIGVSMDVLDAAVKKNLLLRLT